MAVFGVPREEHDAIVADRDAIRDELDSRNRFIESAAPELALLRQFGAAHGMNDDQMLDTLHLVAGVVAQRELGETPIEEEARRGVIAEATVELMPKLIGNAKDEIKKKEGDKIRQEIEEDPDRLAEALAKAEAAITEGQKKTWRDNANTEYVADLTTLAIDQEKAKATAKGREDIDYDAITTAAENDPSVVAARENEKRRAEADAREELRLFLIENAPKHELKLAREALDADPDGALNDFLATEEGQEVLNAAVLEAAAYSYDELTDELSDTVLAAALKQAITARAAWEAEHLVKLTRAEEILTSLQGYGLNVEDIPVGSSVVLKFGEMKAGSEVSVSEAVWNLLLKAVDVILQEQQRESHKAGLAALNAMHHPIKDRWESNRDTIKRAYDAAKTGLDEEHTRIAGDIDAANLIQPYLDTRTAQQSLTTTEHVELSVNKTVTLVKNDDDSFTVVDSSIAGKDELPPRLAKHIGELEGGEIIHIGMPVKRAGQSSIDPYLRLNGELAHDDDTTNPATFRRFPEKLIAVEIDGVSCHYGKRITETELSVAPEPQPQPEANPSIPVDGRRNLLERMGLDFEIVVSDYEEDMTLDLTPVELVRELALGKAKDVAAKHPASVVIGGDTVFVVDGKVGGKPVDDQAAFEMLKNLSGRDHEFVTGYAIIHGGKIVQGDSTTTIHMHSLSDEEIWNYIQTEDEPVTTKAGAYDGSKKGSALVKSIEGNYTGGLGLPIDLVMRDLKEFL